MLSALPSGSSSLLFSSQIKRKLPALLGPQNPGATVMYILMCACYFLAELLCLCMCGSQRSVVDAVMNK